MILFDGSLFHTVVQELKLIAAGSVLGLQGLSYQFRSNHLVNRKEKHGLDETWLGVKVWLQKASPSYSVSES